MRTPSVGDLRDSRLLLILRLPLRCQETVVSLDFPEVDGNRVLLPESFTWFTRFAPSVPGLKPGLSPASINLMFSFYEGVREKSSKNQTSFMSADGFWERFALWFEGFSYVPRTQSPTSQYLKSSPSLHCMAAMTPYTNAAMGTKLIMRATGIRHRPTIKIEKIILANHNMAASAPAPTQKTNWKTKDCIDWLAT